MDPLINHRIGVLVYILIICGAILEAVTVIAGAPTSSNTTFDVTMFGALGDGKTNDAKAFVSAWASACNGSSNPNVTIIVPNGMTFLVSPITFEGPCRSSSITFEILGTIIAPPREAWEEKNVNEWLYFLRVQGLSVLGNGQGIIHGQGDSWWGFADQYNRPTAMRFSSCSNLNISGLNHKNSPRNHISINGCINTTISNLLITAPASSPNTDGIDISASSNLLIQDCIMQTGDDCIAINGGTSSLIISRVTCGPGHGISVGSLGINGTHEEVEGILVDNCTFISTKNGVRIKTWQGGSGFARNINFTNIIFESTHRPVIIDQYYCPHQKCDVASNAVEISDVRYIGLHGTYVGSHGAINLNCSQTTPCTGLIFDDVDIDAVDGGAPTSASCINAHGTSHLSTASLVDCLQS